jgi:hypothetical protein
VINLFDTFFFGNLSSEIRAAEGNSGNGPSLTPSAPRTIMASLNFGF